MISRALVEKFRNNECDARERKEVLEFFEAHPDEWDKYIAAADWSEFQPQEHLHTAVSERMFAGVAAQTIGKARAKKWMIRLSVAASVVGVVLLTKIWYQQTVGAGITASRDKGAPADAALVTRWNTTGAVITWVLPDSSIAALWPNSSLATHQLFTYGNKRTLYVDGKARFAVAKDKSKPFTIVSGDIATTALGTDFTVENYESAAEIKIQLHEGKVVVKPVIEESRILKKDVLLVAGDELIYNKKNGVATITHTALDGVEQWLSAAGTRKGADKAISRPDWYRFAGLSLQDVFEQLSAYYQVDIYYQPLAIKNKYFTGKMEKTDSLDTILADIALLNKLVIERKGDAYYIKQK